MIGKDDYETVVFFETLTQTLTTRAEMSGSTSAADTAFIRQAFERLTLDTAN